MLGAFFVLWLVRPPPGGLRRHAAYDQRWSDHAPVTVQYR